MMKMMMSTKTVLSENEYTEDSDDDEENEESGEDRVQ